MLITTEFGSINTNAPVYYTVFNADKSIYQERTNVGVTELIAGTGLYGVEILGNVVIGKTVVWDINSTNKVATEAFLSTITTAEVNAQTDIALSDAGVTNVRMAKLDTLGASTVTIATPFVSEENLNVIYGNDYYAIDGRAIEFQGATWPVITGATVTFIVDGLATTTIAASVLAADACRIEITKTNLTAIGIGYWNYELKAVLSNTHVVTLAVGKLSVMEA